jgi:hypothetical protein
MAKSDRLSQQTYHMYRFQGFMGAVALRLLVPGWKRLVGMAALRIGCSCLNSA